MTDIFFEPPFRFMCCCVVPGATSGATGGADVLGVLPPTPHQRSAEGIEPPAGVTSNQLLDADSDTKQLHVHDEKRGALDLKANSGVGRGLVGGAPFAARVPAQRRPGPARCYARGTSAGGGGAYRKRC